MAENKIELEIVTPRGRALAASADEVTAPSVDGEFGVLPGHLPLLAALRTGIVAYRQSGEVKRCAIGSGFAEAGPDRLIILTDNYIERPQVDPVVVRKELASVQLELYGDPAPATMRPFETFGAPPPPADTEVPTSSDDEKTS